VRSKTCTGAHLRNLDFTLYPEDVGLPAMHSMAKKLDLRLSESEKRGKSGRGQDWWQR
jgi:hypothetical protein